MTATEPHPPPPPKPPPPPPPPGRLHYFIAYVSWGEHGPIPGMGEIHRETPIVGLADTESIADYLSKKFCNGRAVVLTSWRRFEEAPRA